VGNPDEEGGEMKKKKKRSMVGESEQKRIIDGPLRVPGRGELQGVSCRGLGAGECTTRRLKGDRARWEAKGGPGNLRGGKWVVRKTDGGRGGGPGEP